MQGRSPSVPATNTATSSEKCPTCGAAARSRDENKTFPFCSPKCKLADLERWLNGAYRVAGEPVTPPEDPT